MAELRIKGPLSHQMGAHYSPASRKIMRWGRRAGKTREAFCMGIVGHGPDGHWRQELGRDEGKRIIEWDGPLHRGIAQGWDVYWIARDYKQAGILWREEVEPRFASVGPSVVVNRQDRRIDFKDAGSFIIRSAENINSVRGSGEKLAGVIIEEGAWMDLQTAMRDVLLPALVDNFGWLVIISTTNAGPDGFEDLDVGKRTPSYFNILCEKAQAGKLGPDWEHFYATAWDNPALSPIAIQKLVDEYGDESVRGQDPSYLQEVEAKLLTAGAGVAFPEWRDDLHIANYAPEDVAVKHNFRWAAGGDWGYNRGGLWLFATSSERSLCRHEFYFAKKTAYQVGFEWGKQIMSFPRPEFMSIDTPAVSDGGPDILEQLQAGMNDAVKKNPPVFINPPKGPGSRLAKKNHFHEALRWKADEDGTVQPWNLPALQFHPSCVNMVRTIPRLPRDPKKPGDVDTLAEDEGYDGACSWLMARIPYVQRMNGNGKHQDDHPGMAKRYELEPVEIGEGDVKWSRLPPGYEEEW